LLEPSRQAARRSPSPKFSNFSKTPPKPSKARRCSGFALHQAKSRCACRYRFVGRPSGQPTGTNAPPSVPFRECRIDLKSKPLARFRRGQISVSSSFLPFAGQPALNPFTILCTFDSRGFQGSVKYFRPTLPPSPIAPSATTERLLANTAPRTRRRWAGGHVCPLGAKGIPALPTPSTMSHPPLNRSRASIWKTVQFHARVSIARSCMEAPYDAPSSLPLGRRRAGGRCDPAAS